MAYVSFPNDDHNSRAVTLAEHEMIVAPLGLSALLGYTSTPPVFGDSTGLQVKLRANVYASIRGTRFNNTSETVIAVGANSSGDTRIDLLVLRLRRTESGVGVGDQYTISPVVIAGVPGANPSPPAAVRDDVIDGTGLWDIPLAEITVVDGASTITAAQVKSRAYYISGTGYTGLSTAVPPVEPGVVWRENDTGITKIGTSGGTWHTLYRNTGWVNITTGSGATSWNKHNVAVSRSGLIVVCNFNATRSAGNLPAGSKSYLGPIDEHFRPQRDAYGPTNLANVYVYAQTDGQIIVVAGSQINTGQQILTSFPWTVADA